MVYVLTVFPLIYPSTRIQYPHIVHCTFTIENLGLTPRPWILSSHGICAVGEEISNVSGSEWTRRCDSHDVWIMFERECYQISDDQLHGNCNRSTHICTNAHTNVHLCVHVCKVYAHTYIYLLYYTSICIHKHNVYFPMCWCWEMHIIQVNNIYINYVNINLYYSYSVVHRTKRSSLLPAGHLSYCVFDILG